MGQKFHQNRSILHAFQDKCEKCRNSRWPSKVAGKRFVLKVASRLFIYPASQKFCRIALSHTVSKISVFTFQAEIQDGRQKW